MNIVYLCHYFTPEVGAPSARVHEMSKYWVSQGHQVKVVTGFPNHPTGIIPSRYRRLRFLKEKIDGIEVFRNWVYATSNEGFVKKTLGHISFMLSSIAYTLPRLGQCDVLIVSSPTFFSVFSAYVFSLIKRKPFVFEIRDLWPDAIVKLGVLRNKYIIQILEFLEMFLYKKSSKIVVVTESFKEILVKRGIPASKIEVVTNGVDTDFFKFDESGRKSIRNQHHLENKFIVSYIGTHGISHSLEKIIEVAHYLKPFSDIHFLFVGEGAKKKSIIELAKDYGLTNVTFLPAQPKELMPDYYAASDISLVPLKNIELFKGFIPSKMFEIMACCCPIIASVSGESADILNKAQSAILVEPENVLQLREGILTLYNNQLLAAKLGENGRRFVVQNYKRSHLASRYEQILTKIAKNIE